MFCSAVDKSITAIEGGNISDSREHETGTKTYIARERERERTSWEGLTLENLILSSPHVLPKNTADADCFSCSPKPPWPVRKRPLRKPLSSHGCTWLLEGAFPNLFCTVSLLNVC